MELSNSAISREIATRACIWVDCVGQHRLYSAAQEPCRRDVTLTASQGKRLKKNTHERLR